VVKFFVFTGHSKMQDTENRVMARTALRREKLAERDRLAPEQRAAWSRLIRENIVGLAAVAEAKHVMIYASFRSEVATMPLFDLFLRRDMLVSAPLTLVQERRLLPYRITDPSLDLRPGYCGIAEPDSGRLSPIDPAGIDVVLVPGAVFDGNGGRLGYGGGYYDRFLAHDAPRALRIGLAFEMQVIDRVPVLDHDVKMHYLITEQMIRRM
jgi:5-formyltetrahydrofolate cyclo-ligase